ncbi:MAG: hypothetical protein LBD38_05145 [Streptococcaceae bacterium]|jgi:hypothetical protein|nr:hypothetical protein [Streptococcaceae bacterium]
MADQFQEKSFEIENQETPTAHTENQTIEENQIEVAQVESTKVPKWNWAASGLTWMWGIGNNVPLMIIGVIPIANIVMMILGGLNGYKWLRETGKYASDEEMMKDQKVWNTIGLILFIVQAFAYVVYFLVIVFYFFVMLFYMTNRY